VKDAGFLVIVVTNQPDVPSGITPRSTVDAMHAELRRRLPLDDIRVCFHTDADNCACRKPKPGLLLAASRDCDIDLGSSYLVGDRWRDIDAGRAAGCFTVLVDHGLAEDKPTRPDKRVSTLGQAVAIILDREKEKLARLAP
jgi:D-glycero-D-manno-heptose 1,7-bisphosphate phosphatase